MAQPSRGAGLALSLSLAAHALIALSLFWVPGPSHRTPFDTRITDPGPGISLWLPDRRPAATKTPAGPNAVSASATPENDFPVDVREASVTPSAPVLPAPLVVVGRGSAPPGVVTAVGTGSTSMGGGRASLLQAPPAARTVVYVLDRSLSMGPEGALARARHELLASLTRLAPGTSFQVILYNRQCEPLRIGGKSGFLRADETTRQALARELGRIAASGNTDHFHALQKGLLLRADVLYLVTDSDDLSDQDVLTLTRQNGGRTAIHAVELSHRRADAESPLRRLTTLNGGTFRRLPPTE
jgi:hypothetical protein